MNEKTRDHDLIPAIKPASDEVAFYRRSRGDAPKQSNFNGMLVFSLVLMAIVMGVGGFTLYEVQQKLDQSNRINAKTEGLVRSLEERLRATGVDVSKTLIDLQSQQAVNGAEIDKLWRVAHRENRPKIQELEKRLAKSGSTTEILDSQVKGVASNMKSLTSEFGQLSNVMNTVRKNLVDDNADMTTQVTLVRGQIQDQAVIVEGNRRSISSLDGKVQNVEEAINAFDRYRQQVNKRLIDLQDQLEPEPESSTAAAVN